MDDMIDEEFDELENQTEPQNQDDSQTEDDDFVSQLLRSRGIDDKTKIKFENEDGEIEEVNWDSLSSQDQFNLIQSSEAKVEEPNISDDEIELINAIRNSGMTPTEYINYIQQGVSQPVVEQHYTVDDYSDDELFLADFLSRMGDITDEEAQQALETAKANEELYNKQIQALRKEYKDIEDENAQQLKAEQEEQARQQFEQFEHSVIDQINNFTDFGGYDLNLENDDMQELYDFLVGQDAAGNNYFAKALTDPATLVRTAWLTLHADDMLQDVTEYFKDQIAQVRKESYKKGKEDALKQKNSVVFKDKDTDQIDIYNDLDDF